MTRRTLHEELEGREVLGLIRREVFRVPLHGEVQRHRGVLDALHHASGAVAFTRSPRPTRPIACLWRLLAPISGLSIAVEGSCRARSARRDAARRARRPCGVRARRRARLGQKLDQAPARWTFITCEPRHTPSTGVRRRSTSASSAVEILAVPGRRAPPWGASPRRRVTGSRVVAAGEEDAVAEVDVLGSGPVASCRGWRTAARRRLRSTWL